MTFSNREKREEALREVKFRNRVYARLVNANEMTRQAALRRIAVMEEIAEDYGRMMQGEDLFGGHAVRTARAKTHRHYARKAADAGPDRTGEGAPEEHQPPSPEKTD